MSGPPTKDAKKESSPPHKTGSSSKSMWELIRRYASAREGSLFGVALCAVIISGANQPAQLIIFGQLLDAFNEASKSRAVRLVQFFALMYCVVGVQQFITVSAQAWASTKAAAKVARVLRRKALDAVLAQPMAFFDGVGNENSDDKSTSSLGFFASSSESLVEMTATIQDGLGEKFFSGLQGVFAFVIGIAVSLYYAWSLTLLTIAALPVIALLLGTTSSATRHASEKAADARNAAASCALISLNNLKTVKAFSRVPTIMTQYERAVERAASFNERLSLATGLNAAATAACLYATWAIGLWYGAYLIRRDARSERCTYRDDRDPNSKCVTGGDVMVAFLCVLFGGLSLLQALPGLAAYDAARVEAIKLLNLIDTSKQSPEVVLRQGEKRGQGCCPAREEDDVEAGHVGKETSPFTAEERDGGVGVAFEAVQFAYPSRPERQIYASEGLSFTVEPGSTTALCGPSGGGKSTVLALVLRFYDVSAGRVLFDGKDVRDFREPKSLRRQISYVQQEPVLFNGTIAKNIRDGKRDATDNEVRRAAVLANAHEFIESLPGKYETIVDGHTLSGGQKQRVALARALVREPRLLALDEATSALDARSERVVQAALNDVMASKNKAKNRTTLIVAHRLSTIRTCEKIIVLANGRVVESGSHDELVSAKGGYYRAMAEAQGAAGPSLVDENSDRAPHLLQRGSISFNSTRHKLASQLSEAAAGPQDDDDDDPRDDPRDDDDDEKKNKDDAKSSKSEKEKQKEKDARRLMSWLWAMARPERPYLALGVFGSAVSGAVQPLLGYLMAEFIAVFFATNTRKMRRESRFWALMFVAMAAAASLGEIAKAYGLSVATERVGARVAVAAFSATSKMDSAWHDAHQAGELSARLAQDTAGLKGLLGPRTAQSVAVVVIVVGGLTVSFLASWRLTLVTLGIIPLIVLPVALTASYVTKVAEAAKDASESASSAAAAAVAGIRTVRAFGLEASVAADFDEKLAVPERQAVRKGFAGGLGAGAAAATVLFGAAFQYYIGSIFFREGWVDFDDLMTVLLVIIFLAFGLGGVAGDAVDKVEALQSARRIFDLCQLRPAIQDPPKDASSTSSSGSSSSSSSSKPQLAATKGGSVASDDNGPATLEFEDVAFAYPTRPEAPVFAGFSLRLEPGTTTAVCGESGSGKSSLVQLLLRLYDVDGGAVRLDGVDVRDLPLRRLRAAISVVSQEPCLFAGTVASNIRYGKPDATDAEVRDAAALANARDFIETLPRGYDTVLEGMQAVSGGQKQRIAIARAVVRRPRALLLDEATSALDVKSEAEVQAALDDLLTRTKVTTLIIAHRLATIRNADVIVVLNKGTVVEQGSHDDLMRRQGAYFTLALNDQGHDAVLVDDGGAIVEPAHT